MKLPLLLSFCLVCCQASSTSSSGPKGLLRLLTICGYSGPDVLTDVEVLAPFRPRPSDCAGRIPAYPIPISGNTAQSFATFNGTIGHISCGGLMQVLHNRTESCIYFETHFWGEWFLWVYMYSSSIPSFKSVLD